MRDLIKDPVKVLFLGTDWESLETLKTLYNDQRFEIVGVITASDKVVGRKQVLTPSKVKEYALDSGIEVFHTERNIDRYKKAIEIFHPELIVCKAFGEIVPDFFLEYPKYKAINIHFSILPKYRGAVPIQEAILKGETETGITLILMSKELDQGDILEIYKEPIYPYDTNLSLRKRLVKKSASLLGDVIERWVNNKIIPQKQNDSEATYCWQKDISKENAEIKWEDMDPIYIERMVRAFIPWPIAWFVSNQLEGKSIKIFNSELINIFSDRKVGNMYISENMLLVSTKNPNVSFRIKELQIEGRNRISEIDFINSFRMKL